MPTLDPDDKCQPERVGGRLAAYLGATVGRASILASGWETTVLEFFLQSRSRAFPALPIGAPLALRCYRGSQADAKGARESATVKRLWAAGCRVPRPYVFEPGRDALGAPFMIMERLRGGPLFTVTSFPRAFAIFSLGFFSFVREQARLHQYDPAAPVFRGIARAQTADGIASDAPLLDRVLAIVARRVESGPLPGLREALDRVSARAPQFRAAPPSLVHMDYHPINVMVAGARVTGVIDWVNADVGDRHLDAAMTSVILASSAMEHPRWMRDNPVGNGLRAAFAAIYIPLYHAMAPVDFERLRYCQAVAALLRLSMIGMMRARGPEAVGFRPEAIGEITPAVVRLLSRYATRKSGAAARLDLAAAEPLNA